jgi:SSS family solute:Na+ symporter
MIIGLGIYASRQQQGIEDYYVAGRRMGTMTIACLWMASWVGGASIVGSSARAFEMGVTSIWYIIALALGCFVFGVVMAARIKREGDMHAYLTFGDYIEHRYDGRTRLVVTITMLLAYTAVTAGQLVAAAAILQVLLSWEYELALLVSAAVIVTYTAVGGYLAVTYTDWLQFILLLLGIVVVGMPIAISEAGGWGDLQAALPTTHFDLGVSGWGGIIALTVSIVLSFFVGMDSYTRCYAARDPRTARNGALLAVVFIIPMAISATWLGLASAVLFPEMTDTNGVLTHFVVELFPTGLKGLILVAILAAIMSSADICILSASANYSRDIHQRFLAPDLSNKKLLRLGIMASAVVGLFAVLIAWTMQDIIGILLISFTVLSASLFFPIMSATFMKKVNATAAFWSVCLSLITVIVWQVAQHYQPDGLFSTQSLWPGLFVSATTLTLFSILDRNMASEVLVDTDS